VALDALDRLAPKALSMPCTCSAEPTTWKHQNVYVARPIGERIRWENHTLWTYECSDCEGRSTIFWVAFRSKVNDTLLRAATRGGPIDATKGGTIENVIQWPRWTVLVPKRVEKAFRDKIVLLQHGIHCLKDGYGIGAAAYLRRLVEDEARAIVELVRDAAVQDGDAEAARNAEEALEQDSAAQRLEIAAKRVPASLLVDGRNPLEVLYGNLSGPLHSETEAEAVAVAVAVATMLIGTLMFLFENLKQRVDEKKTFADTMRSASQRLADAKRHDKVSKQ